MNIVNKHGQAIGRKGAESRQRLLDATRGLIATQPAHKLSASAIARTAKLASQTFYLYFDDIDEVLLSLSSEAAEDMDAVFAELDRPWDMTFLRLHSQRFIDAYYGYWNRHRAILSIRNYRADNGHEAFLIARQNASMPIIMKIAERIRSAHGDKALPQKDAIARGVIIFSAIERIAARPSTMQVKPTLLEDEDLKRAEADILTLLFTPPLPEQVAGDNVALRNTQPSRKSTGH